MRLEEWDALPHKKKTFIAQYMRLTAELHPAPLSAAARKAGYNYNHACGVVNDPGIKRLMLQLSDKHLAPIFNRYRVTKKKIIKEYARIAFADPIDLVDEFGEYLPIQEMPEDIRRAISSIKTATSREEGPTLEVKTIDKKGALDGLARINGMFKDQVAIQATFKSILDEVAAMGGAANPLVKEETEDD